MWKSIGHSGFRRACVAMSTLLLVSARWGTPRAAGDVQDYAQSPMPQASSAQTFGAVSKFEYMFGAPARWNGTLHWSYNPANAPAQFSSNDAVVTQLIAESKKWTSVCGMQVAYDGETSSVPQTLAGGPDSVSVIGWGQPDMGISGATYVWYQTSGNSMTLVETDIILDPQ
jgi:hypothetical protein